MPGSKRRALKNLLSPKSDASTPTGSPINSLAPVDSVDSAASASSIASDSRNYMTDEQLAEQQAELAAMEQRKDSIGSGAPAPAPAPPALDMPPAAPEAQTQAGLPPAPQAQGAGEQHGQGSGVFGGGLAAGLGLGGNGNGDGGNGGGGGGRKSSKQKHAERQARKQQALLDSAPPSDPNWDKQLERERQDEIRVVGEACKALGREIHEIAPDGHCMYHAIADQLACIGLIPAEEANNPRAIRRVAAQYMSAHPDEFRFFLPSVGGEDTAEATTHDGVMTEKEYATYCHNVENTGEWGGEPEIQALSRAFKIPIHVIQRGPPTVVSHGGAEDGFGGAQTAEDSARVGVRVVRISYHRRMYGLGEHYNSLRLVV